MTDRNCPQGTLAASGALCSPLAVGSQHQANGLFCALFCRIARESFVKIKPRWLHHNGRTVEPGELEPTENLVIAALLVTQHADREILAKLQAFRVIRAPMYAGVVASDRDVRRDLVELSFYRQLVPVRPRLVDQVYTVGRAYHRLFISETPR